MRHFPGKWLSSGLFAQGAFSLVALLAVALAPPQSGGMILIPLTPHAARLVAKLALEGGASLSSNGPVPGSIIVVGDRDARIVPLLREGIVTLAASSKGCGSGWQST